MKMKMRAKLFSILAGTLLFVGLTAASSAASSPNETAQSVFVQPATAKDGCDPFFPKSSRPYAAKPGDKTLVINSLVIKGVSSIGNRKFVIINNHTFGVGDYGSVITPQGQIYIHCVEINVNNVVVESNGQRQILPFSSTP
jgi:hypothetical protein